MRYGGFFGLFCTRTGENAWQSIQGIRLRANMTQKEVAEMAGLSVLSVYRFENGTVANISLSTFLLLMKAVGCINDLNDLMPEQPESLYLYSKKNKKVQRVRHKRQ